MNDLERDLHALLERKAWSETPPSTELTPTVARRVRRRQAGMGLILGLALAAIVTVAVVGTRVVSSPEPVPADRNPDGVDMRATVGEGLADELGLTLHSGSPDGRFTPKGVTDEEGNLLADCVYSESDQMAVTEVSWGGFYCIPADSELEAWELSIRIRDERVPTQEEIEEAQENLTDPSEGD